RHHLETPNEVLRHPLRSQRVGMDDRSGKSRDVVEATPALGFGPRTGPSPPLDSVSEMAIPPHAPALHRMRAIVLVVADVCRRHAFLGVLLLRRPSAPRRISNSELL